MNPPKNLALVTEEQADEFMGLKVRDLLPSTVN